MELDKSAHEVFESGVAIGALLVGSAVLTIVLTTALLSLAGIPLTAGFVGKFLVVRSGVGVEQWSLVLILVLGSVISIFYYLRVIVAMYMREPQGEAYEGDNLQIGLAMALVAVLILWIGISPGPVAELARQGTAALEIDVAVKQAAK